MTLSYVHDEIRSHDFSSSEFKEFNFIKIKHQHTKLMFRLTLSFHAQSQTFGTPKSLKELTVNLPPNDSHFEFYFVNLMSPHCLPATDKLHQTS